MQSPRSRKLKSNSSFRRPAFAGRGRGRFGRRRDLGLAVLVIGLIYFYSTLHSRPAADDAANLESVRLAHYMNAQQDPAKVWDIKSSFRWDQVPFKYPPGPNVPLPTGPVNLPRVQHAFAPESPAAYEVREDRRRAVRKLFRKNWASYRERAWMRDALLPLSGLGRDQFSGWAATLVDSLDSLWIMGLKTEFDEAVDAVATIDFATSTNSRVNMFETNIRYLGGLLAAYDLSQRSVLLAKAVELGDMLYAGFNTENRMPVDFFDMDRSKAGTGLEVEAGVVSASPGTLFMEFTRLSQITGDTKYYTAVSQVVSVFEQGQMKTKLPGMWPTMVSMRNADVVNGRGFTLGSGADSLYEYITKMHALQAGREARFKTMSISWMDTAKDNMFFRPMLPDNRDILLSGNLDFDAATDVPNLDPESEHLACFLGGTYALGGKLFNKNEYLDVGAKLALGCAYAYAAMPTGMMPERFNMVKCDSREQCAWNETRFAEERQKKRAQAKDSDPPGFTTTKDPRYILRPEAIESIFYLWRITGEQKYQDIAWDMFAAVAKGTETDFANAAVKDVTSRNQVLAKEDYMEVGSPKTFHWLFFLLTLYANHCWRFRRVSGWPRRSSISTWHYPRPI